MTEDETVAWYHRFDGHELVQTPGDDERREAWSAMVHGITKSQIQLGN